MQNLTEALPVETLEMEYFLKLESLSNCQACLRKACEVFISYVHGKRDGSNTVQRKHQDEEENEHKLITDVQALEAWLDISRCWKEGSEEWDQARTMGKELSYQKALDRLEYLLVARMFEMARLNVSGTGECLSLTFISIPQCMLAGYKMRKHITQSLKTRSKAIQTAIVAYNDAAAAMKPPCQLIFWDEIVDFSYLSEFDILQDTRDDV